MQQPITEAVLEGLIHNLRTPLNLILGYAQKLEQPSDLARRIYEAGIRLDDLLQETWEALQTRLSEKKPTELNAWLKSELALLHSVLPVKHRFMLISETFDQAVWANHSPRELAEALEEKLFQLSSCEGMQQITLTVMPGKLLLGCQNELLALWSSETGLCNQPEPQPGTEGYKEKVKRHG